MNNTTQPGAAPTGPAATSNAPAVKSVLRMGVFTLAMINVSAIVSLRGMPAESTYGLSSVFYYIFAAVFFLVPVSLVAAELTRRRLPLGRRGFRKEMGVPGHLAAMD